MYNFDGNKVSKESTVPNRTVIQCLNCYFCKHHVKRLRLLQNVTIHAET